MDFKKNNFFLKFTISIVTSKEMGMKFVNKMIYVKNRLSASKGGFTSYPSQIYVADY